MRKRSSLFILVVLATIMCGIVASHNGRSGKQSSDFTMQNTVKQESSYQNDVQNLNQYWAHIHAAREYVDAHDYEKAKMRYEEAIKASRSNGDEWMARALLKDLYAEYFQYDLALKEIDWLMKNNSRPDVLSQLMQEIQSLSSAKNSNVSSAETLQTAN